MERYRTGLILAAPEFDTYDAIRRYAEHPSLQTYRALSYLLIRCIHKVEWDACNKATTGDDIQWLIARRLSVAVDDISVQKPARGLADMSDDERMAYYRRACELAGYADITKKLDGN